MKRKTTGKESSFLWNNWETPKPSNEFFIGWPDATNSLRLEQVRPTWAPPPPPLNPAPPAGRCFQLETVGENSWPTQRQATDPSGPTTDDRSTNKKNWSLCTLPQARLRPIWCHFVLSYYIESLLSFGMSSTLEFPSYIDLDATKNRRSPKLFVLKWFIRFSQNNWSELVFKWLNRPKTNKI